jgi:hypothetical protein
MQLVAHPAKPDGADNDKQNEVGQADSR